MSWQVQDLLVDSYFKLKEMLSSKDALLLSIIKAEGEAATAEAIRRYEAEHVLPLEKYKKEAVPKIEFYNIGEAAKILKYLCKGSQLYRAVSTKQQGVTTFSNFLEERVF